MERIKNISITTPKFQFKIVKEANNRKSALLSPIQQ